VDSGAVVAFAAGPLVGARRAGWEGTATAAAPSASAGESWRKSDPCSDPAYNIDFHLWFSAPPSR